MRTRTACARLSAIATAAVVAVSLVSTPAAAQGGWRGFLKKLDDATRPPAEQVSASDSGRTVGVPDGYMVDPAIVRRGFWGSDARQFDGRLDQEFAFRCPAGGSVAPVYGTDVYPTFVNACSAAVHTGRITARDGGIIVLRIRPGQSRYVGSRRYGVTSEDDRASEYSYVLIDPPAAMLVKIEHPAPAVDIDPASVEAAEWYTTAEKQVGRLGQVVAYSCPAAGQVGTIIGTSVYSVSSSICTAAAHMGKITVRDGGIIGVEMKPGQLSYVGSTRNGIVSDDYHQDSESFILRDVRVVSRLDESPAAATPAVPARSTGQATGRDVPRIIEGEQGIEVRLPQRYSDALRRIAPAFRPFEHGNTVDRTGIWERPIGDQSDHAAVADLNGDGVLDVVLAGMVTGTGSDDVSESVIAVISNGTELKAIALSSRPMSWQNDDGDWLTNMKVTLEGDGPRPWVRYADVDLKSGGVEWRFGGRTPTSMIKRDVASTYQD
ncbi:MAG TPA: LCCL domain-containing protein [Gemmatimonadales bacterium]